MEPAVRERETSFGKGWEMQVGKPKGKELGWDGRGNNVGGKETQTGMQRGTQFGRDRVNREVSTEAKAVRL